MSLLVTKVTNQSYLFPDRCLWSFTFMFPQVSQDEKLSTKQTVDEDRKHAVEASIVRVMKVMIRLIFVILCVHPYFSLIGRPGKLWATKILLWKFRSSSWSFSNQIPKLSRTELRVLSLVSISNATRTIRVYTNIWHELSSFDWDGYSRRPRSKRPSRVPVCTLIFKQADVRGDQFSGYSREGRVIHFRWQSEEGDSLLLDCWS